MSGISSIYGWQGGRREPVARPECTRAQHAKLIEESGRILFEARARAYERYCRECRSWGREPADEQNWFMHAKMAYCRLVRGGVHKEKKNVANARERRLRTL